MNFFKKHFSLFTILTVCMLLSKTAKAEDKKKGAPPAAPAKQEQPQDGEVDISDVQNQYWKAHDKEFEVIQNKKYSKSGHLEFAPLFGIYQRVDFQDTQTVGASVAYHFNEALGVEVMGYKMLADDSAILTRFKETRGATIEYNKETYYVGIGAQFTPIYAKFSLLGKKISHFDMYVTPNIGITHTIANRFTFGVGVGQKFWVTPKWNIRVEYRWMRYDDKVPTNEGATATRNGGPGFFEETVNNQNLMFGISYLF